MTTTRHDAYRRSGGSNLLSSTEAARMLQRHPGDPLFRRYDQLRASGKLKPVSVDPVVRFDPDRVRELAMLPDDSHVVSPYLEDGRDFFRGLFFALAIAAGIGLVVWLGWMVWA